MPSVSGVLTAGLEQCLATHGETVTYVPSGGEERSITAVVRRLPAGSVPPTGAYAGPTITVTVANDSTSGISHTELNLGLDNIKVSKRPGLTAESRPIAAVLMANAIMLQLEVH